MRCGKKLASRLSVIQERLEGGIVIILATRLGEIARSVDQVLFIGGFIVMGAYGCWR